MLTRYEIIAKYKELHDLLSEHYYSRLSKMTKPQFDLQHGQIWSNMRAELIANGYQEPPILPPVFSTPAASTSVSARLANIETFLSEVRK